MMKARASIGVVLTAWVADAQSLIPITYSGHVYVAVRTPMTWIAASNFAAAAQGRLPIVNDAAENHFLYQQAVALGFTNTVADGGGSRYIWLGASDAAAEGVWRWVDGSLVNAGYTNWGSGEFGSEPDNFMGIQHHLAMGLQKWPAAYFGIGFGNTSQWNDVSGSNSLLGTFIEFDDPDADADGDGQPDWAELVAGTQPTNAASVLRMHAMDATTISWTGIAGRIYLIQETTSHPPVWAQVGAVTGIGGSMIFTSFAGNADSAWRTIEVRAP